MDFKIQNSNWRCRKGSMDLLAYEIWPHGAWFDKSNGLEETLELTQVKTEETQGKNETATSYLCQGSFILLDTAQKMADLMARCGKSSVVSMISIQKPCILSYSARRAHEVQTALRLHWLQQVRLSSQFACQLLAFIKFIIWFVRLKITSQIRSWCSRMCSQLSAPKVKLKVDCGHA